MHSKRSKLLNLAQTALFVTFLHMWNYFTTQSNKTFSWEYSSITVAVCFRLLSKASYTPRPCSKSSHRTLASNPPTGPTVTFPLPSALDLAEPGVLLLPGMFLLRSTALLVSPSDRGPANPSKGGAPTSSGSISIYLLTNTIITIWNIYNDLYVWLYLYEHLDRDRQFGIPKGFLGSRIYNI